MADPAPTSDPRLAMLQELAEIGMELVRDLRDQTRIEPRPDAGLVYARIARAVRQTLALHARLEAEAKVETARHVRAQAAGKKSQVSHIVTDVIEADDEASDGETVDRLTHLYERLADADDCDFADKSVPEIVAQICHDLGVPFDPQRWEPAASPYLPREAAGGGPQAERSEEPAVEGASLTLRPHPVPS